MARRQRQVVSALPDDAAYTRAIGESDKQLVVVDIHRDWCGPCTVMEAVYRKAYIEIDKAEERVKFYTVRTVHRRGAPSFVATSFCRLQIDEAKLTPEQKHGLPLNGGCKPLFVVFKVIYDELVLHWLSTLRVAAASIAATSHPLEDCRC